MKKKNINRNIVSKPISNSECFNSLRNETETYEASEPTNDNLEPSYDSALIYLSETDQERVQLAASLAIDIFTDSHVAQEFTENPTAYMEMHNLSYEGDLDYGIIQMALAFANDEIRQAITNHDVEGFFSLCQTQGLFSLPIGIENADITEVQDLLENAGFSMEDIEGIQAINAIPFIWAAVAVIALAVALLIVDVYQIVHQMGPDPEPDQPIADMTELNPSPITLWAIMDENIESAQLMLSEVANEYYTILDNYLESHCDRYLSDEDFRNRVQLLAKANLIQYLMQ